MDIRDIQKLKAFFFALKESNYQPRKISSSIVMNGELTPIDKPRCLELLRSFPVLEGKSDDQIFEALADPKKIKNILGQLPTSSERTEFEQVLEEKPAVVEEVSEQPSGQATSAEPTPVGGEPAGTMGGGGPGLPSGLSGAGYQAQQRPIRIFRAPKTEYESAGMEGGTGTGTAATNKAARLAGKEEIPIAPRKIASGMESGTGTGVAAANKASRLATQAQQATAATNKAANLAARETELGRRFQMPKMPYGVTNAAKNLSSGLLRGAGKGFGGIGTGLKQMGRGLGSALGDMAGRGIRVAGRTGLAGLDSITRLSNPATKGSTLVKGRWIALLLLGFVMISFFTAFSGANPGVGTTPGGGTGGTGGTGGGLDYTIPFKDPSVTVANPDAIKNLVRQSWTNAQLQNWDTIVNQSIANGWNPAFVLALWIEETGAQGVPNYTDPLGCAVNQPTTDINISLGCLFRTGASYSNSQFADFMCRYSEGLGKPAPCQFTTNPNFPANLKSWYSRLVPSGPGAAQTITPAPITGAVASCPVPGGVISNYSYQYASTHPGTPGHCYGGYNYNCHCGTNGRRAKAIDVRDTARSPSGIIVKLPQINGQDADWTLITKNYPVDQSEGGGVGNTFRATLGTDTWYLDTLHLNPTTMVSGTSYRSGAQISTTATDHVHMTMGKNITTQPVSAGSNSDCDSGWLSSDFTCQ